MSPTSNRSQPIRPQHSQQIALTQDFVNSEQNVQTYLMLKKLDRSL